MPIGSFQLRIGSILTADWQPETANQQPRSYGPALQGHKLLATVTIKVLPVCSLWLPISSIWLLIGNQDAANWQADVAMMGSQRLLIGSQDATDWWQHAANW